MNKDRLLKLAEHLEKWDVPTEEIKGWNFNEFYSHGECGTLACAIGLCPYIWPDEWERTKWGPQPKADGVHSSRWFDIPYELYTVLFDPIGVDMIDEFPLWTWYKETGPDATPNQVAANIRACVTWEESQ